MSRSNVPPIVLHRPMAEFMAEQEERCTILHCRYYYLKPTRIRVCPEIVLVEDFETDLKLIAAYGIETCPNWTNLMGWDSYYHFTLVFEGTSKECERLALYEGYPERQGFLSLMFPKNKTGVYHIDVDLSLIHI